MDQYYRDVKVRDGQLIVHVDRQSSRTFATAALHGPIHVDTTAAVSSTEAVDRALASLSLRGTYDAVTSSLQVLPYGHPLNDSASDRLVWSVRVYANNAFAGLVDSDVLVDAHSGDVVQVIDTLLHAAVTYWYRTANAYKPMYSRAYRSGLWETHKYWAFWVQYGDFSTKNKGVLQSPCKGLAGRELPCKIDPPSTGAQTGSLYGNHVGDAKNREASTAGPFERPWVAVEQAVVWGDGSKANTDRATAGADAYLAAWDAWDMLRDVLDRDGLTGADGKVRLYVHWGTSRNNGTVSESCECAYFGDGDGASYFPFVSYDIVGHELGHLLDWYTAKIPIAASTEGTGIEESNCDIFGTLLELYKHSRDGFGIDGFTANYWLGEQVKRENYDSFGNFSPNVAERYMDDPARDGLSVSCWYDGIALLNPHHKSGPGNHAFWLMANGGTSACNGDVVQGLGWETAARIWYIALLHTPPDVNYRSLREAYLRSAAELYGQTSVEYDTVARAFSAINVNP